MSYSSDVEVIEECSNMNDMFENDIEEEIIVSSSNEDEPLMNVLVSNVEEDKNVEMMKSYDFLQSVILEIPCTPSTRWKRIKILKKGVLVCNELVHTGNILRAEVEALFQQNWRLKERLKKLKRMKKRKSGSIVTRRASGPVVGTSKCISPEKKRVSLDDSKTTKIDPDTESTIKPCEENAIGAVAIEDKYKRPKKQPKKCVGLSEEEKEFYMIEEKIDDLLYEVDVLWDEIKDDEETDFEYEEDIDVPKQEVIKGDEDNASKCSNASHTQEAFVTSAGTVLEKYDGEQGEQSQIKITSVSTISNENHKHTVPEYLSDNMMSRMNEPTTSISSMNTTVKNIIDRTEVINISDGSDSDSDVVYIG